MGHYGESMGVSLSDEIIVSDLKKLADSPGFVIAAPRPGAEGCEAGKDCAVRRHEEVAMPLLRPLGEFIVASEQLISDLLYRVDLAIGVCLIYPFPECRTEVETVVEILRLDEDVRVEQVWDQITPSLAASSLKVDTFLKPSI